MLGVDDFALRTGHVYGTVLVDIETRRPVDVLPERSAESFRTWLDTHPGAEIICRPRAATSARSQESSELDPDPARQAHRRPPGRARADHRPLRGTGRPRGLVREFAEMLCHRHGERLEAWAAQAGASPVSDLRGFAKGLRKDWAAVTGSGPAVR